MSSEESDRDSRIHRRTIESTSDEANIDIIQIVADIEGCDVEALPSFWKRIDDMVKQLFSDPPSPEAQARLAFTYAGYRIEIDQTGEAQLIKVADTLP